MNDTAELLEAIAGFVGSYVVLTDSQLCALALWTLHTHTFEASDCTPYIHITSAEKASGKTRLLEALELVVAKAWLTGRVTPAVLGRKVHAERPTLLLDETDATFAGDPEFGQALRGLLNNGYRRGGKSSICIGQGANMTYVDLEVFSPKALAGIGELPDTVASRSIRIALKRKAPGERVERFRRREADEAATPIHSWGVDWSSRYVEELALARPDLPPKLADRAADSWEALLAIVDLAGDEWPAKARAASLGTYSARLVHPRRRGSGARKVGLYDDARRQSLSPGQNGSHCHGGGLSECDSPPSSRGRRSRPRSRRLH
jgi:Protein of unknown function (DUF3631)